MRRLLYSFVGALIALALVCLAAPDESAAATAPSGDLPDWHQVWVDNFSASLPVGSFTGCNSSARRCTGLAGSPEYNQIWAYPDGWRNGYNTGTYAPTRTISEQNGLLDLYLHTEGDTDLIAAPVPVINGPGAKGGLLYGRYAIRFKATPTFPSDPCYKTAWLLWPDSEVWPRDGEVDFPEGRLNGTIGGFVHFQDGTSASDQYAAPNTGVAYTAWHTATTVWRRSSVRFLLDGAVVGETKTRIPNTPMHWVIQTESSCVPAATTSGHVKIDWATAYSAK